MKLTVNTCYSHVLWIMCAGELFSRAVSDMAIVKAPCFEHEGVSGYIETEVVFTIKDLKVFADLWYSWYTLSETKRLNLYGLAKGYGDCK